MTSGQTQGANSAYFALETIGFMHREQQDAPSNSGLRNLRGSFQPAHERHRNIQDYDIRLQRLSYLHCFFSIGGLAADFPVPPGFNKEIPNSIAHNFVIIDNQNPGLHGNNLLCVLCRSHHRNNFSRDRCYYSGPV